mmetsp:Transcript_9923/g.19573  ORF Transcript_9923/g.19573 Transcript_9923/m.19573 type:complete len:333 (-) Transcript_9923:249-1247(-)
MGPDNGHFEKSGLVSFIGFSGYCFSNRLRRSFAKPGRYSSVREKSEFKVSDDVLIMRRKPPEARGKWIQGYVRMVDGPQLQVQYTYRGITFQYWYHYQQPEVHPMKDKNRWLGLKPSERMQDLPDGESGLFGKEIVYLLFSRKAPSLKRVGAHADGTCFFHAVFHSLDTKDPRDGKGLSYRNLSSEERAEKGCEWRQALSRQVDRKWFAENLGNVCEYKSYLEQYSTATYSVGPTHNMHVAARFQVNIFFVSFYTNPDTKERDFFVRISSPDGAAQYNKEKPSIILFHRAHGERGHYESVQTDEEGREFGRGIFKHSDSIIQHLLTKANKLM